MHIMSLRNLTIKSAWQRFRFSKKNQKNDQPSTMLLVLSMRKLQNLEKNLKIKSSKCRAYAILASKLSRLIATLHAFQLKFDRKFSMEGNIFSKSLSMPKLMY